MEIFPVYDDSGVLDEVALAIEQMRLGKAFHSSPWKRLFMKSLRLLNTFLFL